MLSSLDETKTTELNETELLVKLARMEIRKGESIKGRREPRSRERTAINRAD